MKDAKRRTELSSFLSRPEMEDHLAEMAEKGWLLEKIGHFFWTYRRIEPQKLTFSVTYFPKASQFDPAPSEEQEIFYDLCAHTGWVLAASSAQLQVFYNEQPDPVPLATDPAAEAEALRKEAKRCFFPAYFALLGLGLLIGSLFFYQAGTDPIGTFSDPTRLFSLFCGAMLVLLTAIGIINTLLLLRRTRRAAERGDFWEPRRRKGSQRLHRAAVALVFAGYLLSLLLSGNRVALVSILLSFGLYLPAIRLTHYGVMRYLKKDGVPAGYSQGITLVVVAVIGVILMGGISRLVSYGYIQGWFREGDRVSYEYQGEVYTLYREPAPLTLEDLLEGDFSRYSVERRQNSRTPLLELCRIQQHPIGPIILFPEEAWLDYTVVLVKVPLLYDRCREQLLQAYDGRTEAGVELRYTYAPVDPAPWGAGEAYRQQTPDGAGNRFLLCYGDRLVELSLRPAPSEEWTPTEEQMALVGEKLGK